MPSVKEIDDSIKEYFSEGEWRAISDYEKLRYFNMKRNYLAMLSFDLDAKPPFFMESKKQNPKRKHPSQEEGNQFAEKPEKRLCLENCIRPSASAGADADSGSRADAGCSSRPQTDADCNSRSASTSEIDDSDISRPSTSGIQGMFCVRSTPSTSKRGAYSSLCSKASSSKAPAKLYVPSKGKASNGKKAIVERIRRLFGSRILDVSKSYLARLYKIREKQRQKQKEFEVKPESTQHESRKGKELTQDKEDDVKAPVADQSDETKLRTEVIQSDEQEVRNGDEQPVEEERWKTNENPIDSEGKMFPMEDQLSSKGRETCENQASTEDTKEFKECCGKNEVSEENPFHSGEDKTLSNMEKQGEIARMNEIHFGNEEKLMDDDQHSDREELRNDINQLTNEHQSTEKGDQFVEKKAVSTKVNNKSIKELKSKTPKLKKEKEENREGRYPTRRSVPKINYKEPKDLDEDDFLFCEDCQADYEGPCPIHGPMKRIRNKKVPNDGSVPNRADLTIPDGLSICPSGIKGAGNGVWTEIPLEKGVLFGPYDGVTTKDKAKGETSGYSWMLRKSGKSSKYLDGVNLAKSNWLRYVNCASSEEHQSLVALQYKGKIYYRTFKPVDFGMELLVWYGEEYAKELGIPTKERNLSDAHDLQSPGVCGHECEECGKLFSSESALQRHSRHHPNVKMSLRHKCPECPYSTNRKTHLTYHLLTHSGEKPHECIHCGKGFARKDSLKRHLLIHTGEKPHACEFCKKTFSQLANLISHRAVHLKEKNHMCKTCGKTFTQRCHLKIHMRSHTGQKPFRCQICNRRFAQKSNLNQHSIYKHTRDFPHKCNHCHKGFFPPSELRHHLSIHHSKEE